MLPAIAAGTPASRQACCTRGASTCRAPRRCRHADALLDAQRLGYGSLLACCTRGDRARVPRLVLVTAGRRRSTRCRSVTSVAQAPLWGVGRVLLHEHPELQPRLVDISAAPGAAEIEAIALEAIAPEREDEVLLRGTRRWVRRLERYDPLAQDRAGAAEGARRRSRVPAGRRRRRRDGQPHAARDPAPRPDRRRSRDRGARRVVELPRRRVRHGPAAGRGVRQLDECRRDGRRLRGRRVARRRRRDARPARRRGDGAVARVARDPRDHPRPGRARCHRASTSRRRRRCRWLTSPPSTPSRSSAASAAANACSSTPPPAASAWPRLQWRGAPAPRSSPRRAPSRSASTCAGSASRT